MTSQNIFEALTHDELISLSNAIITPGPRGYNSNRMCNALASVGGTGLYRTYSDTATELSHLHSEICEMVCAYPYDKWEAEHPVQRPALVTRYAEAADQRPALVTVEAWREMASRPATMGQQDTGTGWPA
jgi:hypothetical protein